MYLSEKNKIGVVKVDSGSPLKDAYIVALQGKDILYVTYNINFYVYCKFFCGFF